MLKSPQTAPSTPDLRLHHFLPASYANGPGRRAVVWVQGCTLGCPGCFNYATHSRGGGELVTVESLVERITEAPGIEGVTISGGEPLQQRAAVTALLRRIRRETGLSVLLFTGYTWDEIQAMPDTEWLAYVDVVIAGRYDPSRRLARDLRGSDNQTVYFLSDRYTETELTTIPPAEVSVTGAGLVMSGVGPVEMTALSATLAELGVVINE